MAPPLRASLAAFIGWQGMRETGTEQSIDAFDLVDLIPAQPGCSSKGVTWQLLALLG